MIETVVISDIHGSWFELQRLLIKTGVKRMDGYKNPDVRCIFIGDIVDLGRMADFHEDMRTLNIAREFGDEFIVGNHEFPWIFPRTNHWMGFAGMRNFNMEPALFADIGKIAWQFATDAHGFLISHAGLDRRWGHFFKNWAMTPDEIADRIGDKVFEHIAKDFGWGPITAISWGRGGESPVGGIQWQDESELEPIWGIPQIVGHSFIGKTPIKRDNIWFIDTGKGSPSALVFEDDDWHPVTLED